MSATPLSPAPVDRQVKITWQCAQCNVGWTTTELQGHQGSRQVEAIYSLPPQPYFASTAGPTIQLSNNQFFPSGSQFVAPPSRVLVGEPGLPIPDFADLEGSLIGYRAWSLKDWKLYGTGGIGRDPWEPGINEAKCGQYFSSHAAPDPDCDCGLYALARFAETSSWWQPSPSTILGAVEAWADVDGEGNQDRIFLHPNGFRSQYARIVLLATGEDYPRAMNAAIRALAAEHGADVCDRRHLEDAAKEHGQLASDELLEWAKDDATNPYNPNLASGSYFVPPLWTISSGTAWMAASIQPYSIYRAPPKRSMVPKGIKQTLKTPGPPFRGKYREGDRVKDLDGTIWRCVKTGRPGTWEDESEE